MVSCNTLRAQNDSAHAGVFFQGARAAQLGESFERFQSTVRGGSAKDETNKEHLMAKDIPYDQKYYDPEIECMPRPQLEELQLQRLQDMVAYAYENTVYYKRVRRGRREAFRHRNA